MSLIWQMWHPDRGHWRVVVEAVRDNAFGGNA